MKSNCHPLIVCNIQLALSTFLICVDSKLGLQGEKGYSLWSIVFIIHCIMSRGSGLSFVRYHLHCGFYWNEMSNN